MHFFLPWNTSSLVHNSCPVQVFFNTLFPLLSACPLRRLSGQKTRCRCTAFIQPSSFTSRIQEYSKASRITWHKGRVSLFSYTLRIVSENARVVSRSYVIRCASSTPHSLRGTGVISNLWLLRRLHSTGRITVISTRASNGALCLRIVLR